MFYEKSLVLYRQLGDKAGTTRVLCNLGITAEGQGDYERAAMLYEESLTLARELGSKDVIARALNNLGVVTYHQGDHKRAIALYEESLALVRELGNKASIVVALNNLAESLCRQGNYGQALPLYKEGLALAQALGYKTAIAFYLEGLAEVVGAQRYLTHTAQLWGTAEMLRVAIGAPREPADQPRYEQQVSAVRTQLGAEIFAQAWAKGRALPLEQAITFALAEEESVPARTSIPEELAPARSRNRLSQREQQIAALVATGHTNREIATELAISQRTVDTHIGNILTKLSFTSRTQIISWAVEQQLIAMPVS